MRKIIYTRHDGGVSVCTPSDWILSVMGCGGLWDHLPSGEMDRQIASMVNRGVSEAAAHRYAKAVTFGGCTTSEALEIIRDRDCAHLGTAIELWDEVPVDRWFRDAWRRSHNGGPISINLELAKPIQWQRIKAALVEANRKRDNEMLPPIGFDSDAVKTKIRQAREERELRSIWPKEINGTSIY